MVSFFIKSGLVGDESVFCCIFMLTSSDICVIMVIKLNKGGHSK